ncbi:uncharacterized protein LOC130892091 [Diorhabda carinulata]|uniref:uncharacterized protein LOC130892091 n=1 Tax=Diorhabda carinulata TaxID=1163345 RepID=UPI0025A2981E|nr:uncharacterized protein LOC130892091 [Diorhabda carinulata]
MAAETGLKFSQRLGFISNTVFHQLVLIIFVYISYVIIKYNDLNPTRIIHYSFSTGAYIPLMAEGIILFNETNTWSFQINRSRKAWIHGVLLSLSLILLTIGIAFQINAKDDHFKTTHAITGLVSWILCFVLTLTGVITIYSPKLKNYVRPVVLKTIHSCLGLSCYAIGITSIILAIDKSSFTSYVSDTELITINSLVILLTIWSVIGALKMVFNNLKDLFF